MHSRGLLSATQHLKRACFQKENKRILYYIGRYYHNDSNEENKFCLEENTKENMKRKSLGHFMYSFKKELMKRKLLLLFTFSIMAISIDIRCVSCEKPHNFKIQANGNRSSGVRNTFFNGLEHLFEKMDKKNRYYILKSNNKVYMVQYSANLPIEDRCYVCNINCDLKKKETQEETKKEEKDEDREILVEEKEEDIETLEEEIYIGSEDEKLFVKSFEKVFKENKNNSLIKSNAYEKHKYSKRTTDANKICVADKHAKQQIFNAIFDKKLKCTTNNNKTSNNFMFAGVVDGHGGWVVAEIVKRWLRHYVKQELSENVEKHGPQLDERTIIKSLEKAHLKLDDDIRKNVDIYFSRGLSKFARIGACSLSVLIDDKNYYISNLGDTNGLLGKKKGFIKLNNIHNANSVAERKKLIENHPNESDIVVCKTIKNQESEKYLHMLNISDDINKLLLDNFDHCYVKGRLQPTRDFGDFYLKQKKYAFDPSRNKYIVNKPFSFPYITAKPEIRKVKKSADDQFIVLMTDGVTDFLEDEEVVNIVRKNIKNSVEEASKAVVQTVLERAAMEAELTLSQLLSIAPHYKRRLHDDTTVLIINLSDSTNE